MQNWSHKKLFFFEVWTIGCLIKSMWDITYTPEVCFLTARIYKKYKNVFLIVLISVEDCSLFLVMVFLYSRQVLFLSIHIQFVCSDDRITHNISLYLLFFFILLFLIIIENKKCVLYYSIYFDTDYFKRSFQILLTFVCCCFKYFFFFPSDFLFS